jgi:D-amino-acid oxidase
MSYATALPRAPKLLIIGAGVVGLTTALVARRRGYEVIVVAAQFAPDVTSVVAGALWEWPPAVCGHHRDSLSLERSKHWAVKSYQIFAEFADNPRTGVHMRPAVFYFRRPVAEDPTEFRKMRELAEYVEGFHQGVALAAEHGVSPDAGVQDAYTHLAPTIDTAAYLQWLQNEALAAGCQLERRLLEGPLKKCEQEILREFGAQTIVNCSGLGAARLVNDGEVYPLRGALVHVRNDGVDMPRITTSHCMAFDNSLGGQNMVFIVPRGRDRLVLGGLVQPGEWDTSLTMDDLEVSSMVERCRSFLPVLSKARLVSDGPVRAGLRPARHGNIRLEAEPGTRTVHCYGHGGSGVTLSWGCAAEAVDIVDKITQEQCYAAAS